MQLNAGVFGEACQNCPPVRRIRFENLNSGKVGAEFHEPATVFAIKATDVEKNFTVPAEFKKIFEVLLLLSLLKVIEMRGVCREPEADDRVEGFQGNPVSHSFPEQIDFMGVFDSRFAETGPEANRGQIQPGAAFKGKKVTVPESPAQKISPGRTRSANCGCHNQGVCRDGFGTEYGQPMETGCIDAVINNTDDREY
jgi:hypothetical protein